MTPISCTRTPSRRSPRSTRSIAHDCKRSRWLCIARSRLLAHNFHEDALVAPPVKLGIEDSLPCTEVDLSFRDGENDLVMNEDGFQVCVAIVLPGAVMLLVALVRRKFFEPLVDIVDEAV